MRRIPVRTLTWLAACAAHDLSFWADSPIRRTVWAVCDDQRFHLVRVNADNTADHICGEAKRHGFKFRAIDHQFDCSAAAVARPFAISA